MICILRNHQLQISDIHWNSIRSFFLLLVLGVLLVNGVAAKADDMATNAFGESVINEEEIFNRFDTQPPPEIPRFESEGSGPVLLRHKLKKGSTFKVKSESLMAYRYSEDKEVIYGVTSMTIDGSVSVEEINKGLTYANILIDRYMMTLKGTNDKEAHTLDTSSGETFDDPRLEELKNELANPIMCAISSTMIDSCEESPVSIINNALASFIGGLFIELPVKAVSVGDSYEAARAIIPVVEGELHTGATITVHSIAKDKKKVLLTPASALRQKQDPSIPMTFEIKRAEITGWIIFNVEAGMISSAELRYDFEFLETENSQSNTTNIVMIQKIETSLN